MKCLRCNTEINETMQVCPSCGLPLTEEALKKAGLTRRRTGWITFFSVWNYIVGTLCLVYGVVFLMMALTEDTTGAVFVLVIVALLFAIASFVCGYGLWRLKSYGRTIQLILAVFWLTGIPIGTILGILAFVHLSKPKVKNLFTEFRPEGLGQEEIMKMAKEIK